MISYRIENLMNALMNLTCKLLIFNSTFCRYHLSGSKSGQAEIFADNLPGLPDNIRKCSKGGYWVGMATCRYGDNFSVYDFTANKPWLRRLAATVRLMFSYFLI